MRRILFPNHTAGKALKILSLLVVFSLLLSQGCQKEESIPILITYPVTDITVYTAYSGGNISHDGGSHITARGLIWQRDENPGLQNYEGITFDGEGKGEFISHITDLEHGIKYYLRAYATNNAGTGYGQVYTFSTTDGVVEFSVYAEDISYSNVTGIFNIETDGGDNIVDRGLFWSRKTLNNAHPPDFYYNDSIISVGQGNESFTYEITGLKSYREYFLRAYAINSIDTFISQPVLFKTIAFTDGVNGTVTDIEGNVYNTITMGGNEWMTENLRTTKLNDGTPIPLVTGNQEWSNLESPAWCWYENDEEIYGQAYGALYNRYVIFTNKLCPEGWRVPDLEDLWDNLTWYFLYEYNISNYYPSDPLLGNALKSCRQVNSPLGGDCDTSEHPRWAANNVHYGLDSFGFSALPGGYRVSTGNFSYAGNRGYWWSTFDVAGRGRSFTLISNGGEFNISDPFNNHGLSVRCIRAIVVD